MKTSGLQFVLVTPARNEEDFIELTIQSVVRQTVRPLKWAIVSDGSTDRTDEIVKRHLAQHEWIEFVRMPEREERHFAGKVDCFNAGFARVKHLNYDIVGSLDADISFGEDYFEFLLQKFAADQKLGVAGTPFSEGGATYDYRFSSTEHVSGACQLFRRQCFEAVGGYVPAKDGGIDVIAVLTARSKGWHTQTFIEKASVHHRPMGSAKDKNKLAAEFKLGVRQYRLGFHPLWQLFRSVYQMTRRPYIAGGSALLLGYAWAMVRRVEWVIAAELVELQRRDQMRRLRGFLRLGPRTTGERVKEAATIALETPPAKRPFQAL
jgi:glycosyltransferase involved in cell wall biosynthesis